VYKVLAGLLFLVICYGAVNAPAKAQLPNTNMGRFVHQPGDNQYTDQTQAERHGSPAPVYRQQVMPQQASGAQTTSSSSAYVPTPKPIRPDISLLPIVADEPVKPAGFPPLPDRLDLPVSSGWTRDAAWVAQAPRAGASAGGQMLPDISKPTGMKEHYLHYQPGAFQSMQERLQARPGGGSSSGADVNSGPAYIHAPTNVPARGRANDSYNVNTAAVPISGTAQAIRQLGREPRLGNDAVTQPEAPQTVAVNQSTTEDLSLQDDEFAKQQPQGQNNMAKQMGRQLMYAGMRTIYTGASMGASMALYR
jgi:hypothetical protein